MRDNIGCEEFSSAVNTPFKLNRDGAGPWELELVTFQDLGSSEKQEQFSVVFRGPGEPILRQGIYDAEHESIGSFALFLVPIKRDEQGVYYEAIFNRFPEQERQEP